MGSRPAAQSVNDSSQDMCDYYSDELGRNRSLYLKEIKSACDRARKKIREKSDIEFLERAESELLSGDLEEQQHVFCIYTKIYRWMPSRSVKYLREWRKKEKEISDDGTDSEFSWGMSEQGDDSDSSEFSEVKSDNGESDSD